MQFIYALNWEKVTVNTYLMLQKISISNKLFELLIHQRILKKIIKISIKITNKNYRATEDWSGC